MENKKSLLIIFTLIISAHLLLFANIVVEEKIVVAQNKPASTISKINLKNVVIKKPEPKVEPVVEPIVEKIIEKPLPETKSKNIVKQENYCTKISPRGVENLWGLLYKKKRNV